MRNIPKKNYYILIVLLIVTVLLTLLISNIYLNKEKQISSFYQYSNKITSKDFKQFMVENSDAIVYISDKYDLSHKKIEKKLESKIYKLSLNDNLIFIDKNDIDKTFLKELKETYNIKISLKRTPIVLVIIDNKVVKNVSIKLNTNIDSIIDYGDFE